MTNESNSPGPEDNQERKYRTVYQGDRYIEPAFSLGVRTELTKEPDGGPCKWVSVPHCGSCGKAINSHSDMVVCKGKVKMIDGSITECGFVNYLTVRR